jgi:hypothetical protein
MPSVLLSQVAPAFAASFLLQRNDAGRSCLRRQLSAPGLAANLPGLHRTGARLSESGQSCSGPVSSVPLPSHLLLLLHRSRAALRIAPGTCLDLGPPLALPQKRPSSHADPVP